MRIRNLGPGRLAITALAAILALSGFGSILVLGNPPTAVEAIDLTDDLRGVTEPGPRDAVGGGNAATGAEAGVGVGVIGTPNEGAVDTGDDAAGAADLASADDDDLASSADVDLASAADDEGMASGDDETTSVEDPREQADPSADDDPVEPADDDDEGD